MPKEVDRFFHLKFPKWKFMEGFANFIAGPTKISHWDAQFKMYGDRYDDWGDGYGERFTLELNGIHVMNQLVSDPNEFISEEGKYVVKLLNRGFLPDVIQWVGNKPQKVVEYVDALPLIGAERVAALTDVQQAKLSPIEITYAQDLFNAFMHEAKTEVDAEGMTKIAGWSPWIEALSSLLNVHPVKTIFAPDYVRKEGSTIKGANIELHIANEVYRTADFYWHGDKTSDDARTNPNTIGDYGAFIRCSAEENYSFASFHFEVVR